MARPTLESLKSAVIDPFSCAPPGRPALNYADYLQLPAAARSGDEMDAVDHEFSTRLLDWLGFSEAPCNVQHNRARTGGIPDHIVEVNGVPVLVWEDKGTAEEFQTAHERQIERYAQGRATYAVWTNARRLIGFRVEPDGALTRLMEIDVEAAFGVQSAMPALLDQLENDLAYFKLLLSAQRFIEFDALAEALAIDESTFLSREPCRSLVMLPLRPFWVELGLS